MFSLQIFTEILIVGLLLLLGISPLLLLMDGKNHNRPGFLPILSDLDAKMPATFLLLVVAYAVGAAGNRLVDDFWEKILPKPEEKFEKLLVADLNRSRAAVNASAASAGNAVAAGQTGNAPPYINCDGEVAKNGDCIKVAEFALRERSQATQDWFDHRRSYIRLVRAAAIAALLLLISMGLYNLVHRRAGRYKLTHFAVALFFFVVFTLAHWVANEKYWKRIYEIYIGLPPVASKKQNGS